MTIRDSDNDADYQSGLREGRVRALEQILKGHHERLDKHERRLIAQERITFGLLGAIALIELLPTIQRLLNG